MNLESGSWTLPSLLFSGYLRGDIPGCKAVG